VRNDDFSRSLVALGIALLALASAGSPSLALDPRAAACGASVIGSIVNQTAIGHARDYQTLFPKMGYSPELETDTPAFVVAYAGTTKLMGLSLAPAPGGADGNITTEPAAAQSDFTGVVCVVVDGSDPVVYVNVDTSR
jgi:hypothetical protein